MDSSRGVAGSGRCRAVGRRDGRVAGSAAAWRARTTCICTLISSRLSITRVFPTPSSNFTASSRAGQPGLNWQRHRCAQSCCQRTTRSENGQTRDRVLSSRPQALSSFSRNANFSHFVQLCPTAALGSGLSSMRLNCSNSRRDEGIKVQAQVSVYCASARPCFSLTVARLLPFTLPPPFSPFPPTLHLI